MRQHKNVLQALLNIDLSNVKRLKDERFIHEQRKNEDVKKYAYIII